jgi:threonine aldolase
VPDAYGLCGALYERGIQLAPLGPRRLRAVTHLDVDAEGIERALTAFRQVLAG